MGVLDRDAFASQTIIKKMQQALYHRGPNDGGVENFSLTKEACYLNHCSIAFNRLSIRDLSTNGHQPMYTDDHEVMIAFNGEIYNSEELRPLLVEKGVVFRGGSDTEVLLNLYQQYGIDKTLSMLDGMFAICIADFRTNKLYLCRDRIGEKPLYIYKTEKTFMFASEYKAFYAHPDFSPTLDYSAVDEYFLFRYVAGDQTFLKGVHNLTPGSYLEFEGKNVTKKLYWTLPDKHSNKKCYEENKKVVADLINKSVSRRLISDVPIGLQLSGGVDSSYLCHVVKDTFGKKLNTYCITFENEKFSEEPYIDVVNKQLNLTPRKYNFKTCDFIKYWRKATYYFEAPMNHEGSVALFQLNEDAAKEVTVMLCGDGPDESMGGYTRFHTLDKLNRMKSNPIKKAILLPVAYRLAKRRGAAICDSLDDFAISRTQYISSLIYNKLIGGGYSRKQKVYTKRRSIISEMPGKGIRKFMNYEMYTYMQDILMRTDKISMASSIEIRVPYLMPELLEYLCEIPDKQLVDSTKVSMYGTKSILKSLCCETFGNDFTYRNKMGLTFPFIDYFDNPIMREYVEKDILPSMKKRGIVNYDYFISIWNKVPEWKKSGSYDSSTLNAIWCTLSFELWAQMYLDNNPLDI